MGGGGGRERQKKGSECVTDISFSMVIHLWNLQRGEFGRHQVGEVGAEYVLEHGLRHRHDRHPACACACKLTFRILRIGLDFIIKFSIEFW
jgi:hypothetical protein